MKKSFNTVFLILGVALLSFSQDIEVGSDVFYMLHYSTSNTLTDTTEVALLPRGRPAEETLGLEIGKSGEYILMSGDSLEMNGNKITGLPYPDNETDAVNKGYVDENMPANGQPKAESTNIKLYRNY